MQIINSEQIYCPACYAHGPDNETRLVIGARCPRCGAAKIVPGVAHRKSPESCARRLSLQCG